MKHGWVFFAGLALLASSCTSVQPEVVATPSQPATPAVDLEPLPAPLPAPPPAVTEAAVEAEPESRWIELVDGAFVDTRTSQPFVPIGVNLLRKVGGGGGDRMFALYDPEWVDAQLDAIGSMEFNTVRFFLDMCMTCTTTTDGIRADYLDDLADLLTRIEQHGLVAMPTSNDVPDPGFSERLPCCDLFGGYRNSLYLSAEGHRIAMEYWTELLDGLARRAATASAEENAQYDATHVVDGSDATWWSAAQGPPQWVEIELDGAQTVARVNILIGHVSPPGPQTHRVFIRTIDDPATLTLTAESSADVEQGEWIPIVLPAAIEGVTAVRVETVAVDGWVILHEIEITSE